MAAALTGYREWPAGGPLTADVFCLWASRPAADTLVLPDACIDIVWDGTALFVAGPDTGPVAAPPQPGGLFAGLRFRPGRAPGYLGVPAAALTDQRVALAGLWGEGAARRLAGQLSAAPDPGAAAAVLAAAAADRQPAAGSGDPLVGGLLSWLRREPASAGVVGAASRALGAGERQLHRRCCAAVGYGPKMLERVLRFRRAQRLAEQGAGLAAVAAAAGYADQAHLARDCRRLSGLAPSDLFKTAGTAPR
ncbi:MAG: helix-turn-helix domain-containing protein [Streptosporangiaceae bacterium]